MNNHSIRVIVYFPFTRPSFKVILCETSRLNVSIAPREQNRRVLNRLNRFFFAFVMKYSHA